MKKLMLAAFVLGLFFFHTATAQSTCTPQIATGMPGVSPTTDLLACVERGITFSEVIYIENFDAFNTTLGTAQLNYLRIDSVTNVPCGLEWQSNKADNTFYAAETGCVEIYGTTTDSVGQYRVKLYITVDVDVPGLGTLVFSDEAEALVESVENLTGQPTGINFRYFLRVIEPGNTCPLLDTTSTAINTIACQEDSVLVGLKLTTYNGVSVDIYPNPASQNITLDFGKLHHSGLADVMLSDVSGKVLLNNPLLINAVSRETIDVSALPKGVYFLRINTDTGSVHKRILIE